MHEDLEGILARVASGELTPDEAEPMIARATTGSAEADNVERPEARAHTTRPYRSPDIVGDRGPRRAVRLQVTESGRSVVDLRIPMNLASLAGSVVPGLANAHVERIRDAIRAGDIGPVLEIRDEDGDGVIISTE